MKMVEIELDKKRVLKFGVRAYVEVEKTLDTPLDKINFDRQESIYAMLHAGLIHADHRLTLDKVYDIVENMVDKKAEEEDKSFMEAFSEVLAYIGEKVGEALGNGVKPDKKK